VLSDNRAFIYKWLLCRTERFTVAFTRCPVQTCEAEGFVFERVDCLHARMRWSVRLRSRSERFCAKRKVYYLIMQFIYNVLFTSCMYGRVRFTRVERLMQIAELNLRPRDGKVFRDLLRLARTRRRDVTRGDGVGRLARDPRRAVWGAWIGLCGCACRDARLLNVRILSAVNSGGRERPSSVSGQRPRTPEPCVNGDKESRTRTLSERKDQDSYSREHPC